jgi:hypothetical protein
MISPATPLVFAATSSNTPLIVAVITALAFGGAIVAGARGDRFVRLGGERGPVGAVPIGWGESGREPRLMRWLANYLLFLLVGYMFFDRAFAWLHPPGTPFFVAEIGIALGITVLLTTKTGLGAIIRASTSLKLLRWFMLWGAVLLAIGVVPWGLDAVRDSALWYYSLVALFVAVLIISQPSRIGSWLDHYGRLLPLMLLWYPAATIIEFVAKIQVTVPDSYVTILAHRTGNMAVMSAIAIAYMWLADADGRIHPPPRRVWLTTLATIVVLFTGLQNRGGLVATTAAMILLWFILSKRRAELAMLMLGAVVALAALGIVFDIRLALFDSREVSIDQFTKNVTSIFDHNAGGARQTDTIKWRLNIWTQVLDDVTRDSPIMGFGMGPDLGKRYGITTSDKVPLRSPHNSHVGVLARMGYVGVLLWVLLWITWLAEMQTLRRRLKRQGHLREAATVGFLLIAPVPILVNAIFDPTLEGAQVAFWLWSFFGAGAALVVLAQHNRFPLFSDRGSSGRPDTVLSGH